MVKKVVEYPNREDSVVYYDSFVLKEVDEDTNKVLNEIWAHNEREYNHLEEYFDDWKSEVTKSGIPITEYNSLCFEYLKNSEDNEGSVKVKSSYFKVKSKHRILVYIQGFLNTEQ